MTKIPHINEQKPQPDPLLVNGSAGRIFGLHDAATKFGVSTSTLKRGAGTTFPV